MECAAAYGGVFTVARHIECREVGWDKLSRLKIRYSG